MKESLAVLQDFRKKIYDFFPKRKDAVLNLLDALTSDGKRAGSVVQLSQSNAFKRQYSSITDAISIGLREAKWLDIQKLTYQKVTGKENSTPKFVVDCTPNPRPHAHKLADRSITHAPNPAPGNKPICVGHQYSVLSLMPTDLEASKKHWLAPISAKRVASNQKGNEVGMQQVVDTINDLKLSDEMSISVGDSLYSTEICRATAAQQENLVHIFRMNSKRNVFAQPDEQNKPSSSNGRSKEFGVKMNLGNPETHLPSSQSIEIPWKSQRGKEQTLTIHSWNNMLLRGSRSFRSSEHPIDLLKITLKNSDGTSVYKRPLWLAVFGKRRHELDLTDVYNHYVHRYDIEHFFRFAKNNLLMDSYQTPDTAHEESWWNLCLLAYNQLFLSKDSTSCLPAPWERYLPEYSESKKNTSQTSTPSQTQKGFAGVLDLIGTPAQPSVPRGNPLGRSAGDLQKKRPAEAIIFKGNKSAPKKSTNKILSGSESGVNLPNVQKTSRLINLVRTALPKLNLTASEFSKKLINST